MPWIKSLTIGLFCYIISGVLQDLLVRLVTTVCLVKTGPPLPRGTMHKQDQCRHAVSVCPSVCSAVSHIRGLCQNE